MEFCVLPPQCEPSPYLCSLLSPPHLSIPRNEKGPCEVYKRPSSLFTPPSDLYFVLSPSTSLGCRDYASGYAIHGSGRTTWLSLPTLLKPFDLVFAGNAGISHQHGELISDRVLMDIPVCITVSLPASAIVLTQFLYGACQDLANQPRLTGIGLSPPKVSLTGWHTLPHCKAA